MNDPTIIGALGTFIAAIVGAGTWFLTKRGQDVDETSSLIDDALKLQSAAQEAYRLATNEMEELRDDIRESREEVNALREAVQEIRLEMEHWRLIARRAKDDYEKEVGTTPFWWSPYQTRKFA